MGGQGRVQVYRYTGTQVYPPGKLFIPVHSPLLIKFSHLSYTYTGVNSPRAGLVVPWKQRTTGKVHTVIQVE